MLDVKSNDTVDGASVADEGEWYRAARWPTRGGGKDCAFCGDQERATH